MPTQNSNKQFHISHSNFQIEISEHSGFCFGVVNAINKAEQGLENTNKLFSLGSIVHNAQEVNRLEKKGLKTINLNEAQNLKEQTILFRAHGEPPESYQLLKESTNTIIDGTCPVVLKIQQRIKNAWLNLQKQNGQLVIFGKTNHAEVIGLNGQTNFKAIIIESNNDIDKIDFERPIELFSQTTKSINDYKQLAALIQTKANNYFKFNDTICRQVANRQPQLAAFSIKFEMVLFVGDPKSSNSKVLFNECKNSNNNSYFITAPSDLETLPLKKYSTFGICGATSTPQWLMEDIAKAIEKIKLAE